MTRLSRVRLGAGAKTTGAATLAVLACAGAALAANQVKGATYSGTVSGKVAAQAVKVSFKVSASGRRVTGLTTSNTPLYCSGGGPATPVHFASATISSRGTFTSTGRYVIKIGPLKGQVGTTLKITGKFAKGGGESGTLTTTYPKTPKCGGKSPYSTTKS